MQPITAGYWLLVAIGILGELTTPTGNVRRRRAGVYLSMCTSLAILLVWGFWLALAAQTPASVVAAVRSRLSLRAAAFLIARTTAALGVAAAIVSVFGFGRIRREEGIDPTFLLDLIATILAWLTVYYVPAIVVDLRYETWRTVRQGLGVEILASASLLFLAPIVVADPRGWNFALLVLPLLALNRLSGLVIRQAISLRQDPVTGLLNQRGLTDAAADLGRERRRGPGRYALLLIRLNGLRGLDDAFGRRIVDAILARVAVRLAAAFGDRATVGRPDTDDLVVLVPTNTDATHGTSEPTGMPEPIGTAVLTVNQALAEPVEVDGLPYDMQATIGIARAPEDAQEFSPLVRYADAAIRYGHPGPDGVTAFTPRPQEELDRRLRLMRDFGAALRGEAGAGHIEFAYQPQVRLDSGDVVAVESLLRWTHPQRGTVPPDELLAIVEPTPLMHELTTLAIDTAVHQLRQWNDAGIQLCISVNVSVHDMHQDWLVNHVLDLVQRSGVAAGALIIEVTENAVISDPDLVRHSVSRLTTAGLQVAVDDFGSGFASLQHLRQLRLSQLKIDKGLVASIDDNPDDRAVVRSVIELAQALKLTVVAEGVENQAVHEILRRLGCFMGQGYFYGRPTSAAEIARALSPRPRAGHWLHRSETGHT